MAVVRWTNLICGALLVIAARGFVVFVPGNLADYVREPEDVWLGGFWVSLLGLLAALCLTNAWRANRTPRFVWIIANLVVVVALTVLLLLGRDDPAVPPLLVCVLSARSSLWSGHGVARAFSRNPMSALHPRRSRSLRASFRRLAC